MLKLGAELLCALKDFACDQIPPSDSFAYLKGRVCRNTSTQPLASEIVAMAGLYLPCEHWVQAAEPFTSL